MDGLNHSVITGECSGCVAYQEKVARLEDEHERDTQALQNAWDDFRIVEQKRDEARAANAALTAAGQKLREELAEVGDHTDMIWDGALLREWDAALSDTGEGWLPVDLVWSYLWHKPGCPGYEGGECCCAFDTMMAKVKEAKTKDWAERQGIHLSDERKIRAWEGEGWLPPEVRKQVREAIAKAHNDLQLLAQEMRRKADEDSDYWLRRHVHDDITTILHWRDKFRAALDALEVE